MSNQGKSTPVPLPRPTSSKPEPKSVPTAAKPYGGLDLIGDLLSTLSKVSETTSLVPPVGEGKADPNKGMAATAAKSSTPFDPAQEIRHHLASLAANGEVLNSLSDQLTKEVGAIEAAVNQLNLGVTGQVKIASSSDDEGLYSELWRLAYAKVSGKWGFVVEHLTEDLRAGDESYHSWAFKDAPREYRMTAVDKIPALLGDLVVNSKNCAMEITKRVNLAKQLAASVAHSGRTESKK